MRNQSVLFLILLMILAGETQSFAKPPERAKTYPSQAKTNSYVRHQERLQTQDGYEIGHVQDSKGRLSPVEIIMHQGKHIGGWDGRYRGKSGSQFEKELVSASKPDFLHSSFQSMLEQGVLPTDQDLSKAYKPGNGHVVVSRNIVVQYKTSVGQVSGKNTKLARFQVDTIAEVNEHGEPTQVSYALHGYPVKGEQVGATHISFK